MTWPEDLTKPQVRISPRGSQRRCVCGQGWKESLREQCDISVASDSTGDTAFVICRFKDCKAKKALQDKVRDPRARLGTRNLQPASGGQDWAQALQETEWLGTICQKLCGRPAKQTAG